MNREITHVGAEASYAESVRKTKKALIANRTVSVVVYILLGIWALFVLFPFYWMVMTSFKTEASYNAEQTPSLFVRAGTLENFVSAFSGEHINLFDYIVNTYIFTVITTALMLIIIVPAAYAFSRLEFKGKSIVFTVFLSLMMIPNELVVITNFYTMSAWGLKNTFTGLILPSVTSVFYIYLLKENFSQIPDQLYRAAKVDGTSDFKYMWKVVLPICKPTIITVTILKVIECWNSYAWPRLITSSTDYYLVSQGIEGIRETSLMGNYPGMMAAVVVVSIPLIVLFLVFRNKIMEGVARGGMKG